MENVLKSIQSRLNTQLTKGPNRLTRGEWAGGIHEEMATMPQLRIGRHWFPFHQILIFVVVVGSACLVGGIFFARYLRTLSEVHTFIASHPGTGAFGPPVTSGFPVWLRYQHYFNLVLMLFIIRSGLQILADHPRLTLDAGCAPDSEFRLSGPVPYDRRDPARPDRIWTAKGRFNYAAGLVGPPGNPPHYRLGALVAFFPRHVLGA
jgi:hypothetical protein